jgi:hypothetical protein
VTFSFDNSLTVPKGTIMTLSLSCNVTSAALAGATYQWGADTTVGNYSVAGSVSGNSVNIAAPAGTAPTMSVSGTGSVLVSTDPSAPSYLLVAGGTTGVTANVLKFRASNESVNLSKVGLKLTNTASSSASDLTQVYIYAGSNVMTTGGAAVSAGTLLGTATFTGNSTTATSTLNTLIQLPRDVDATLVVKTDVADIGTNQPGTEGHLVAIDFNNSEGTGNNSGATVKSGPTNFSGSTSAGIRTFNTIPTFALDTTLPSTGVSDGRLMQFKVTADSHGPVGINQFTFKISTTTGTVSTVQLFAYTDAGYSQAVSGNFGASNGQFGSNVTTFQTGVAFTIAQGTNPIEIPAGTTYYFKLIGSVSAPTNTSVVTTLLGDSAYPTLGGSYFMGAAATTSIAASSLVWSPNATTTVSSTGNDWTNGFGVLGLPGSGLFQTRSN